MTTTIDLGRHLNTVDHPVYPCIKCGQREPLDVYEKYARWACGFTLKLPPLGSNTPLSTAGRGAR